MDPDLEPHIPVTSESPGLLWQDVSHDEEALEDRVLAFIPALKYEALRIFGIKVTDAVKVYENGCTQIYSFTLQNGSEVIVKVRCSIGEEFDEETLRHMTATEVTILKMLQEKTTIPVPRVYGANWSTSNSVGIPYIFHERIFGLPIRQFSPHFSENAQERVFAQLINYEMQLMQLSFDKIGSLLEDPFFETEYVSQLLPPLLPWDAGESNRGPWSSSLDMLRDFAHIEYDFVQNQTERWKLARASHQHLNGDEDGVPISVEFYQTFYRLFLEALEKVDYADESPFSIHNPNFEDILVADGDPSRVIGLVNWEGSCVFPLWNAVYADQYIRDLCPDEDSGDQWSDLRTEMLEESIPFFADVPKNGHGAMRDIYDFLQSRMCIVASPQTLRMKFMEMHGSWPKQFQAPFYPLVGFTKDSSLSGGEG
ncbi:hypothetical protein M422DRAFT_24978 [Sphaerobolus stellatus SS14]|nr:hypothetical protein M422DRAFT_24978 [Sphaerobolus stellatus SS14]